VRHILALFLVGGYSGMDAYLSIVFAIVLNLFMSSIKHSLPSLESKGNWLTICFMRTCFRTVEGA